MFVDPGSLQQNAQTGAPSGQVPPSPKPLEPNELRVRDQILAQMQAARDAAREMDRQASQEANQVRIENGVPVPMGPGRVGRPNLPGQTGRSPDFPNMIPPQAVDIAQGFFFMIAAMVIGWPLARAFGRRLEKGTPVESMSPVMGEQLQRIERAVDAMSIEVERISEAQRFMAKLQNTPIDARAALPASEAR